MWYSRREGNYITAIRKTLTKDTASTIKKVELVGADGVVGETVGIKVGEFVGNSVTHGVMLQLPQLGGSGHNTVPLRSQPRIL